jgi:hypothetical protein
MRPPVDIEALMEEWSKDAPINETDPQKSLAQIPSLHAKYLHIMTHHNLMAKKLQYNYNERRRLKWEWYNGDLNNPEDLSKYNLPPQERKVIRQDIPQILDADSELNTLLLKKVLHEEIADFCKAVLKELGNRTFQLKSYIDYERFIRGQ